MNPILVDTCFLSRADISIGRARYESVFLNSEKTCIS
jgi:hypothetical protein